MNQASTSGPVAFQVTANAAFNETVSLACGGLPAGATCSFQPSGRLARFGQSCFSNAYHQHGSQYASWHLRDCN